MDYKKNKKLTLVTILFFSFCGICAVIGFFLKQKAKEQKQYQLMIQDAGYPTSSSVTEVPTVSLEQEKVSSSSDLEEVPNWIYVHVCGAVQKEGVYTLLEGSRGVDAIEVAGGFIEGAATAYCNLAETLVDGMKLYIPFEEELSQEDWQEEMEAEHTETSYVNINTADKALLMTLPGIGESKAEKILQYRVTVGKFETVEDLMNVSGIGQSIFNSLCDKITV